jgi:hypothetical protein
VAQSVGAHPFGDLGHVRGSVAGACQLAHRHWVDGVPAGEQPAMRPAQCDTSRAPARAGGSRYPPARENVKARLLLFCLEKRASMISCMSNVVTLFAKPCGSLSSSAVRVLLLGSYPFRVLLPDRGRRGRLADLCVDE